MKRLALRIILLAAKHSGLFALSRLITARDLRIVCYHGAALRDEDEFRPTLFIRPETFARRMRFLARSGFPVLELGEAVDRLRRGALPRGATVITIDDGWFGAFKAFLPVLARHGFPATLYVATYYVEKQTQVFNVALDYVFWKSRDRVLDLASLDAGLAGRYALAEPAGRAEALRRLIEAADALDGAPARQALLRAVCEALGLDWRALEAERLISFMTREEAREMAAAGIDIQLHTHRHRFPDTCPEDARAEIGDNRRVLADVGGSPLRHFCYPSGVYSARQVGLLPDLGIDTATTTKPGFNRRRAAVYELTRFLDSERVSDLEFEAEMTGFFELIRRAGYAI